MTAADARRRRGWRNIGVGLRFSLVFTVVLVLIAMLAGLGFYVVQAYQRTGEATRLSAQRMVEFEALEMLVVDQQSSLRGYLLGGQPHFRDAYEAGQHAFDRRLEAAKPIMRGDAEQVDTLDRIDGLMVQWRRDFAEPALQLRHSGPAEALQQHLDAGRGHALVARLREELGQAGRREQARLRGLDTDLAERARAVQVTGAAAVLAALFLMLLTVRLLVRSVVHPLNRLADATRRMAAGGEDVRIGFTGQRDEIGDIARALASYYSVNQEVARNAWVSSHVVDITDAVVHEDTWQSLAAALLGKLCPAVDAVSGALFRVDADKDLALCIGGWAGRPVGDMSSLHFSAGEGPVGECLRSRCSVVLKGLPDDYPAVRSGTGSATPRLLRLEPLLAGDDVVGIVELTFLADPEETRSMLLSEVVGPLALSMARLGSSLRTRELLSQSRAQAEELQRSEEALRASEAELRAQAQELRAANAELVERGESLRRASEAIQRQSEEIERASRYKSEFLANMSHELRTPLNALLILARTLVDNEEGNLTEEQVESAQIIQDSGQNLLRLINNVLDLSKIEAGRVDVAREALEVPALLRTLERQFTPLADNKSLALRVSGDAALGGTLYGDVDKLRQILTNLIGNAIKFTERGEVVVSATRDRQAPGDGDDALVLHVSVRDTGIGIPPDLHDRIFGAFEQADSSTSRRYGGSGLGLAISRRLAEVMGGSLQVESEEGAGSCFHLRVLLYRKPPAGVQAGEAAGVPAALPAVSSTSREAPAPPGGPGLLLIVEDDARLSRVLAGMARQHGCQVLQAGSGREAVALARQHHPAGILLDVGLPDMDGWAVCDALKRDPATADIPVHFLSAHEDSERARSAGAASYLTKPVGRAELQPILEAVAGQAPAAPVSPAPETVAERDAPAERGDTGRANGELRGRRVLLVDDDVRGVFALSKALRARGLEVRMVNDGSRALELLEGSGGADVEVVLMDLMMPGMDGFETIRRLRAMPGHQQLPVIALTAKAMPGDREACLQAGASDYLSKPVDVDKLCAMMRGWLERKDGGSPEEPAT